MRCEDCGSKVYGGACVNCHEELYIAEQHYELDTWDECSEKFKKKVIAQEIEIAKRLKRNKRLSGEI